MIVKKAQPLAIECVVRGYLAGSGWKEYRERQTVCGIKLPPGLKESSELPEPIFTPATKAETGHDENISFAEAAKIVGADIAEQARAASLKIYNFARDYARQRGIIIADTKFEFGLLDGRLILIDEVLTPDSSRFWPADQYQPGKGQPSFDKQFVRDLQKGSSSPMSTLEVSPAKPRLANPGRTVVNDFAIQVATVNGCGSQTANTVLMRAIFQMGVPVSGKNMFPSNIAGLPTWFTIRASKHGYIGRSKEINFLVAIYRKPRERTS